MSFEMSETQKRAFSDATNGMSAESICHLIFFAIGVAAIIWLLMIFKGSVKGASKGQWSIFEGMGMFAWAIFIFTMVGVVIYYT